MTLLNILELISLAALCYASGLGLFALTYLLMDRFIDWHIRFKQRRKDKAAKVVAPMAKNGKDVQ